MANVSPKGIYWKAMLSLAKLKDKLDHEALERTPWE